MKKFIGAAAVGAILIALTGCAGGAGTDGGDPDAIVVGFSLSWAGCSADFNTYLPSDISAAKLIGSTFVGLYIPSAGFQIIGAAFGAAVAGVAQAVSCRCLTADLWDFPPRHLPTFRPKTTWKRSAKPNTSTSTGTETSAPCRVPASLTTR